MKKAIFGIAIIIMIPSCVSSTGVMVLGPDTFSITTETAPAAGGRAESKRLALLEANQYCKSLSKELMTTKISARISNRAGAGVTDINFQCLNKDDSGLERPRFQGEPNIIIQDNR